jgi:hypothetical protein
VKVWNSLLESFKRRWNFLFEKQKCRNFLLGKIVGLNNENNDREAARNLGGICASLPFTMVEQYQKVYLLQCFVRRI